MGVKHGGIHALFSLARPTSLGADPTSFQFLLSSAHPSDGLCHQVADDFRRLVPTQNNIQIDYQHAELSPAAGATGPWFLVDAPWDITFLSDTRFSGMSSHGVPPFFAMGSSPPRKSRKGIARPKTAHRMSSF